MVGFQTVTLPGRSLALALAVAGSLWWAYTEGRKSGEATLRAEIAAETERKLRDATKADDDAMRCAASPECRMQSDGFRRD